MQILTIAGTVGKDAVLRTTQGGEPVLSFSLAVDNGKDANGNKRDATWFNCSIWGKRATSLQNHIAKGSKLTLSGRPTARAHDGKAYLGLTVNGLSFQGGGQRQDDADRGGQSGSPAGYADDDGDLPF
jgi:single-strand DNA-binding protein